MTRERDMQVQDELLRPSEVVRRYKFGGPWLRKQRRAETGPPYVRLGRLIFYRKRDLDNFVLAHIVEPNGGIH